MIAQDVVEFVVKVGVSLCLFGHDLGSWFRGTILPDAAEDVSEDEGRSLVRSFDDDMPRPSAVWMPMTRKRIGLRDVFTCTWFMFGLYDALLLLASWHKRSHRLRTWLVLAC